MKHPDFPVRPGPADDPRDLDLESRRALARQMADAQETWRRRLADLVEPPAPEADFPAFLMETPPFAVLRAAVGKARRPNDLPLEVRDQLQWFVDRYRDYLRTTQGETCFADAPLESSRPIG